MIHCTVQLKNCGFMIQHVITRLGHQSQRLVGEQYCPHKRLHLKQAEAHCECLILLGRVTPPFHFLWRVASQVLLSHQCYSSTMRLPLPIHPHLFPCPLHQNPRYGETPHCTIMVRTPRKPCMWETPSRPLRVKATHFHSFPPLAHPSPYRPHQCKVATAR